MNNYRQITFRYLKQNKKRTILTIIGIVLAVALFSAIGTLIFSFQHNNIELEKIIHGNYEVSYNELNEKQVNSLKNNFKISNYAVTQNNGIKQWLHNKKDKVLDVTFGDEEYYKHIKTFKMIEGNIPKNPNEIILERKAIRKLNKKLGDIITIKEDNEEKAYEISGFYKPDKEVNNNKYFAYGLFNSKNLNPKYSYSILVNLKDKKDIYRSGADIGENLNLSKEQINFNSRVLNAMLQSNNFILKDAIKIAVIVIIIIILSTVAVIYNSFNISVAERIKHFGILRSIGASPSKIRAMVFMEGIIMYLISTPIGILLGYFLVFAIVKILIYCQPTGFNIIKDHDANILFNIHFYPKIILLCCLLAFITVFLSIIMPMITASRISSPIDAIRDSGKFKKEKIKIRKSKFIKLLFGIEGQVAYKNIRRNNKRFVITILSLSISFIMFVTITSIIVLQERFTTNFEEAKPYEAIISPKNSEKEIDKKLVKEIENSSYIKGIYAFKHMRYPIYLEKYYINNTYLSEYEKTPTNEIKVKDNTYVESFGGMINSLNENCLKCLEKSVIDGKIDMKALKEGGVILFDTNREKIEDKMVINRFTSYKVGDTIKIPNISKYYREKVNDPNTKRITWNLNNLSIGEEKVKELFENGDYTERKIVAIINKNPCNYFGSFALGTELIFEEEFFEKEFVKLPLETLGLTLKEDNDKTNNFLDSIAEENDLFYSNFQVENQVKSVIMNTLYSFIYGFIIIISLIAIVNIINTITMGLLLRKKEFATLNAIGMTKRQLSKMVILEGVLHGVIVSVFGSAVSLGILKFLKNIIGSDLEFNYSYLSIVFVFFIGIIGVITLTLIASLTPLRKFKKMNIIESIKEEE